MQDRYAGDAGDFAKYGLLRQLIAGDQKLRLGIVWYLFGDAESGDDGKHIGYLNDPTTYKPCDPDLFCALKTIVGERRTVAAVEAAGLFPPDTAYFGEAISFSSVSLMQRTAERGAWAARALARTDGCDIVFVDPDNGLQNPGTRLRGLKAPKYTLFEELRAHRDRGQSLVIYQHRTRTSLERQLETRRRDLSVELGCTDGWALHTSLGTGRLFFVVPAAAHHSALRARSEALVRGRWSRIIELYDM